MKDLISILAVLVAVVCFMIAPIAAYATDIFSAYSLNVCGILLFIFLYSHNVPTNRGGT